MVKVHNTSHCSNWYKHDHGCISVYQISIPVQLLLYNCGPRLYLEFQECILKGFIYEKKNKQLYFHVFFFLFCFFCFFLFVFCCCFFVFFFSYIIPAGYNLRDFYFAEFSGEK